MRPRQGGGKATLPSQSNTRARARGGAGERPWPLPRRRALAAVTGTPTPACAGPGDWVRARLSWAGLVGGGSKVGRRAGAHRPTRWTLWLGKPRGRGPRGRAPRPPPRIKARAAAGHWRVGAARRAGGARGEGGRGAGASLPCAWRRRLNQKKREKSSRGRGVREPGAPGCAGPRGRQRHARRAAPRGARAGPGAGCRGGVVLSVVFARGWEAGVGARGRVEQASTRRRHIGGARGRAGGRAACKQGAPRRGGGPGRGRVWSGGPPTGREHPARAPACRARTGCAGRGLAGRAQGGNRGRLRRPRAATAGARGACARGAGAPSCGDATDTRQALRERGPLGRGAAPSRSRRARRARQRRRGRRRPWRDKM
jgi:hypothetical protein